MTRTNRSGGARSKMELGPIPAGPFTAFITGRFDVTGKRIEDAVLARVLAITGGHPYATQRLCYEIWQKTERGETAGLEVFSSAFETVLESEDSHFTLVWEEASTAPTVASTSLGRLNRVGPLPGVTIDFATHFRRQHGSSADGGSDRARTGWKTGRWAGGNHRAVPGGMDSPGPRRHFGVTPSIGRRPRTEWPVRRHVARCLRRPLLPRRLRQRPPRHRHRERRRRPAPVRCRRRGGGALPRPRFAPHRRAGIRRRRSRRRRAPGSCAELVGLGERARGRLPNHVRGGRTAELHRRRMNHPAARHFAGRRLDRLAESDRRHRIALRLDRRAACPRDRARDTAAVAKLCVRCIRDRVDVELGDVRLLDLDLGHRWIVDLLRPGSWLPSGPVPEGDPDRQQLLRRSRPSTSASPARAQTSGELGTGGAVHQLGVEHARGARIHRPDLGRRRHLQRLRPDRSPDALRPRTVHLRPLGRERGGGHDARAGDQPDPELLPGPRRRGSGRISCSPATTTRGCDPEHGGRPGALAAVLHDRRA